MIDARIEELRAPQHLNAEAIVAAVLASVQDFSVGPQSGDLTLLVARVCR